MNRSEIGLKVAASVLAGSLFAGCDSSAPKTETTVVSTYSQLFLSIYPELRDTTIRESGQLSDLSVPTTFYNSSNMNIDKNILSNIYNYFQNQLPSEEIQYSTPDGDVTLYSNKRDVKEREIAFIPNTLDQPTWSKAPAATQIYMQENGWKTMTFIKVYDLVKSPHIDPNGLDDNQNAELENKISTAVEVCQSTNVFSSDGASYGGDPKNPIFQEIFCNSEGLAVAIHDLGADYKVYSHIAAAYVPEFKSNLPYILPQKQYEAIPKFDTITKP